MGETYVRFSREEARSFQSSILLAELSILNSIKRLSAYRKIRSSAGAEKISFKVTLDGLEESMNLLDKQLPKVQLMQKPVQKNMQKIKEDSSEVDSKLEAELQIIKEKLAKLR